MRPEVGLLLALVGLAIAGCATARGGATSGPPVADDAGCQRSVEADVETARGRLRDGRPERALLYVEALAACPEATAWPPFLELALDVYEETGRLNEAWSVARLRHEQAVSAEDEAAVRAVSERMERFRSLYVVVLVAQDGRRPPRIRYAGPVQDAATRRLLEALDDERGVWVGPGLVGYWLYPGRYEVAGEVRVVEAGSELRAGELDR